MAIQRKLKTINNNIIDISDFEIKKSIKIAKTHKFKKIKDDIQKEEYFITSQFDAINIFSFCECVRCEIICTKDINDYYFYEDNILFMTCDEFIIKSIVE